MQLLQFLFLGKDSLLIRKSWRNIGRLNKLLISKLLRFLKGLLMDVSKFKLIERLHYRHVPLDIIRLFKGLVVHSNLLMNFSALLRDSYGFDLRLIDISII